MPTLKELKVILRENNCPPTSKKRSSKKTSKKKTSKKKSSKKTSKKKISKKKSSKNKKNTKKIDSQLVIVKKLEFKLNSLYSKLKDKKTKNKDKIKSEYKKLKKKYEKELDKLEKLKKSNKGSSLAEAALKGLLMKPINFVKDNLPLIFDIWKASKGGKLSEPEEIEKIIIDKIIDEKFVKESKGSSLISLEEVKSLMDKFNKHKAFKGKEGSGIKDYVFEKLANAYRGSFCNSSSRKLYPGEYHALCSNFCGPGTRMDLADVRNTKPYNGPDSVCKQHDIDYMEANNKTGGDREKAIRDADIKMLKDLEKYKNEEPYYSLARLAISSKNTLEDYLPFFYKRWDPEHFGQDVKK